jgi:hypothetical protein
MRVFLAALVPTDRPYAALDPGFGGTQHDELGRSFWPDLGTARIRLYPDLDDGDTAFAFERLRPQAPLSAVAWAPEGAMASIVTTRDNVVDPRRQEALARDVLGVEPLRLEAGHSPFLSHAPDLADLLESLS